MSPILKGIVASGKSGRLAPTAEGSAFEIAKYTVPSGGAADVTFTVPSDYRHFEIQGSVRTTRTGAGYDWFNARINGDTASNYSFHITMGQGAATYQYGTGSVNSFYVGAVPQSSTASGMFSAFSAFVADYRSSTKKKVVKTFYGNEINANNSESNVGYISGGWHLTEPVRTMTFILPAGGSFAENSTFTLIGYK